MPEMSDDEFKVLRGSKALLDELLKSPKTKRDAEKLVKTLHPETVITEDHEAPLQNRIKALEDELAADRKKASDAAVDGMLGREFEALKSEGFTEEGIEEVKGIMVERKIASPADAAAIWHKRHPPKPQEPSNILPPSGWGFGAATEDEDRKLLYKDEDAWLDKVAPGIWRDAQQGINE